MTIVKKKILSLIIAIILSISSLVISNNAVFGVNEDNTTSLIESQMPNVVSLDGDIELKHIRRISSSEKSLNEICFENVDGSITSYTFNYPVKYLDKQGNVVDKSNEITETEDGFESLNNDIKTTFGNALTDGISITYNDIKLKMIPLQEASQISFLNDFFQPKASLKETEDCDKIIYKANNKTQYEYTLTAMGVKEDIVLKEYDGQNIFEFNLYTNGYKLIENENGQLVICNESSEVKALIGEILVFSADEKNNTTGNYQIETIKDNSIYKLSVIIDEAYLQDKNTIYPVTIDPTIEVKSGSGAIQDVTINNKESSDGSSGSLFVGKRATYGISRILMRFPGLNLSNIASANNITSAYISIRDLMCESESMTVFCHTFTGTSWNEASASWSNTSPNSYVSSALSSKNISYSNGASLNPAHRYSFNITNAVKGWKNGTYSQSKGIIFKASSSVENASTNIKKTFASYNRSAYQPILVVNYTTSNTISASNLKIYQTENTYINDGNGNKPEDMKYNTKTQDQLRNMKWITWTDFTSGNTVDKRRSHWESLCKTTSTEPLQSVALNMISTFMSGSGSTYSNTKLTSAAKEHETTTNYVNAVKGQIKSLLSTYKGDIYKLRYTASTRTSNPLVQKMRANNINQPVFNKASDKIKGLTFCVNGLWGNEIIVKSYTCNGSSYSCTLTFTLYDHFGLNEPDIDKYGGTHEGFRDWYILQHFKEYNGAYKPFVSKMSFDVSFSGTI